MNKIALIVSGVGYETGSSVFEIPFILKTLEKRGMIPQPAVPQDMFNQRGLLISATQIKADIENIFNDKVYNISDIKPKELDGAIIVGGKGNLSVLSDYSLKDENAQPNPELKDLIRGLKVRGKPIGTLGYGCVPLVLSLKNVANPILTCGGDPRVQDHLEKMGTMVINTTADNVVIDEDNAVFSSHGVIPSSSIYRASLGIEQVINAIIDSILGKPIKIKKSKKA